LLPSEVPYLSFGAPYPLDGDPKLPVADGDGVDGAALLPEYPDGGEESGGEDVDGSVLPLEKPDGGDASGGDTAVDPLGGDTVVVPLPIGAPPLAGEDVVGLEGIQGVVEPPGEVIGAGSRLGGTVDGIVPPGTVAPGGG
jgi:hypothetical protein